MKNNGVGQDSEISIEERFQTEQHFREKQRECYCKRCAESPSRRPDIKKCVALICHISWQPKTCVCTWAMSHRVGTRSTASETCDAKKRTRWNASLPSSREVSTRFCASTGTMNLVAAEVTRRKPSLPQNPPRYLGGYAMVHGKEIRSLFSSRFVLGCGATK